MTLDLAQVEDLCQRLYNSQVSREREEAEKVLAPLGENKEHLLTCREILDKSRSPYAQLFAATSFRRLVTENEFPSSVHLEMRNYVLEYMIKNVAGLEGFVLASLIRLICRIARIGWCEEVQQRQIVDSCQKLLVAPASIEQYLLGGQILNGLITEMNASNKATRLSHHGCRKTSMAFRDGELLKIFQMALETLDRMRTVEAAQRHTLLEEGLKIAISCITFDFIGTGYDEASDEPLTIQVPSTWRTVLEDPRLVELTVTLYTNQQASVSRLAIELLVYIASVRRSVFSGETERRSFLTRLVDTSLRILEGNINLQDSQNFNTFCKFLGRLKANFNLQDLAHVTSFNQWIEATSKFTVKSLEQWLGTSGSIIHLISLWARMVTSLNYVKLEEACRLVESKILEIVHAYINSRMESVVRARAGTIEDPLEEEGRVLEQLDSFFQLCRFQYAGAHEILNQYIEPLLQRMNPTSSQDTDSAQCAIAEGRMTWMVYIIGSIIKGRPASPPEEQDAKDGELSSRVFLLSHVLQQGYHLQRRGEVSRQRLDLAILSFFDSFRGSYIAENRMVSSKLFVQMLEQLGNTSGMMDSGRALEMIVDKVVWNLQFYATVPRLITASLRLFRDVSATSLSCKTLPRLDTIKKILSGCSSDFAFLNEPANGRSRTLFYSIISRLLFNESTPAKFEAFVAPIHQVLDGIRQFTTAEALRSNVPAHTVSGVFRDLRGILEAVTSDLNYNYIFDWLYPNYGPVIVMCLEAWFDQPDVTTPILKFMAEFTYNKTNRISFGVTSPNGYLLFRLVSEVIVTYGQRVGRLPKDGNVYRMRLKGTWVCLFTFSRALIGQFANFGVFQLYRDPALNNAMEVAFKLMTMLETKDVVQYKKVGKAYFPLIDMLLENHMDFVAKLDFQSFRAIISVVEAGLKSFDASSCSQCASAIDHLATYYYKYVVAPSGYVTSTPEAARSLDQHLQMWPSLFLNFLKTLMDIALFEEASAMWSLSRPILALIVINESWFAQVKEDLVRGQPENRKQQAIDALSKLMENVERNLESKNRDRFTHQLSALKHDFKAKKKSKKPSSKSRHFQRCQA